jgi:hypothetical protein
MAGDVPFLIAQRLDVVGVDGPGLLPSSLAFQPRVPLAPRSLGLTIPVCYAAKALRKGQRRDW